VSRGFVIAGQDGALVVTAVAANTLPDGQCRSSIRRRPAAGMAHRIVAAGPPITERTLGKRVTGLLSIAQSPTSHLMSGLKNRGCGRLRVSSRSRMRCDRWRDSREMWEL
jgi:hypothetical protein